MNLKCRNEIIDLSQIEYVGYNWETDMGWISIGLKGGSSPYLEFEEDEREIYDLSIELIMDYMNPAEIK